MQNSLEAAFPDGEVTVVSDDDVHYEVRVLASVFEGKRALHRHQMIYAALGDAVGREIHALSIQAMVPGEENPSEEDWAGGR